MDIIGGTENELFKAGHTWFHQSKSLIPPRTLNFKPDTCITIFVTIIIAVNH